MPSPYMEARTYGIGQLISERQLFRVPDHQRDYAWTEDVVEQFLSDVIGAIKEEDRDYFLGLVVLVGPAQSGIWEIIDGQQRLATTTMVYSAICQWLSTAGREKDAVQIQSQFIGITTLGEDADKPRLNLNVNNRKAFVELVVNKCNDELMETRKGESGRFSSDRRLIEAAIVCRKRVRDLANGAGVEPKEQAKVLYKLADYLRNNTKIVCVDVPSTANAYVIFESLNDRGLDLSVLDLVKNHMFGLADDRLPEVQMNWTKMVSYLGDRRADDFLKVFWTSQFGRIQRGRLFDEWRDKYSTKAKVEQLAKDLAENAEMYSALELPDHEVWEEYSKICRERVKILCILSNRQVHPILLASLHRFENNRMETLLQHLITLTVRYQIVGRGRTGALEITCARVAGKIFTGELNTAMKVWKELAPLIPKDTDFKSDFCQYSETKAAKARYILCELEKVDYAQVKGAEPSEWVPAEDTLTVEHIFPRNPSNVWGAEMQSDPELRVQYVNRLGNLCLVDEKPNRQLAGSGFEKKKAELYSRSKLRLTSQIAEDYDVWNRSSIESRQRILAELAVLAWPFPQAH